MKKVVEEVIVGRKGVYLVSERVGQHPQFRIYKCVAKENPGAELVLKIASEVRHNPVLDREAFLLNDLRLVAERVEEEYKKGGGEYPLNNRYFFPRVVDSATIHEQGNRRANVYAFDIEDTLGELVPLIRVRTRQQERIDRKTSVWILGKFLKMLVFTQSVGVAVGNLRPANLLVQRKNHLVSVFDWTAAKRYEGGVPDVVALGEIRAIAQAVLLLLAEKDDRTIPESDQDPDDRYLQRIQELSRGMEVDARRAHQAFYELIETLWGRTYHPWTTHPLSEV